MDLAQAWYIQAIVLWGSFCEKVCVCVVALRDVSSLFVVSDVI